MADGFIVRKGGVAVNITAAPSINFVSKTFDSITFTITNNDVLTADIFWEINDSTPDANTFSLAGGATSSNQVASGLDEEETYTIFAFANAEGKAGSQTTSQVRTTPAEPIIYTAATGGTTQEYDSGGKRFKSHTFTSSGTFTVTTVGDNIDDRNKVDYLIIAGGASGGCASRAGGGGGAGGYRTTLGTSGASTAARPKITVTASNFGITIGAGGAGRTFNSDGGINGAASSALGVSTVGGGRGMSEGPCSTSTWGGTGGSGGGAQDACGFEHIGASGTAFEGTKGGNGSHAGTSNAGAGGGGGAGQGGINSASGKGGNGGAGLANLLRTGSNETRAGGGGGSHTGTAGFGGTGGGGDSTGTANTNGSSATVNTGSGGGGARGTGTSGSGAGGIVVIRYEIAPSV